MGVSDKVIIVHFGLQNELTDIQASISESVQ